LIIWIVVFASFFFNFLPWFNSCWEQSCRSYRIPSYQWTTSRSTRHKLS
jgi:hypothetical protein